jgi:hypothetical protein
VNCSSLACEIQRDSVNVLGKADNTFFQNVAEFRYLWTSTNRNCIRAEIKGSLNSGNAWYHAVHNHLFLRRRSKNVKVNIGLYETYLIRFVWV